MSLSENMARFLQLFAKAHNLSLAKLQEITKISHNMIYIYTRGEGNPSFSTVEYMAEQLAVSPEAIVMGVYAPGSKELSVLVVDTVQSIAGLSQKEQQRFIQMFLVEVIKLWDKE